jgi:branched-chain amino acid transport system permease protein
MDLAVLWTLIGLMATSVAMEWSVCRTPNFATADIALASLAVAEVLVGPGAIALIVGCCTNLACRLAVFVFAFRPLHERRAGETIRIACSLGISLVAVSLHGLLIGTRPAVRGALLGTSPVTVLGVQFSAGRIEVIGSSLLLLTILAVWIRWSRLGRALILLSSNLELAACSGLRVRMLALGALAWSSILAFGAVRVLGVTQELGPHDGGFIMAFAISVALIGHGRPGRTALAAAAFAVFAYAAGELIEVDIGRAAGLVLAAALSAVLDRPQAFPDEQPRLSW